MAQKLSDLTQAVAVLLTRTFLMEGKQHAGDRWQHLSSSVPSSMAGVPGKKSNYADALRREQELRRPVYINKCRQVLLLG